MKPEEMDRKIAEFLGYRVVSSFEWGLFWLETPEGKQNGYRQGISEEHAWAVCCPEYSADLNAMHHAEQWLFTRYHDAKEIFIDRLCRILDPASGYRKQSAIDIIDATAEQHALAFVETIGQFKP